MMLEGIQYWFHYFFSILNVLPVSACLYSFIIPSSCVYTSQKRQETFTGEKKGIWRKSLCLHLLVLRLRFSRESKVSCQGKPILLTLCFSEGLLWKRYFWPVSALLSLSPPKGEELLHLTGERVSVLGPLNLIPVQQWSLTFDRNRITERAC